MYSVYYHYNREESEIKKPYTALFIGPAGSGKVSLADYLTNKIWNDDNKTILNRNILYFLSGLHFNPAIIPEAYVLKGYSVEDDDFMNFYHFINDFQDEGGIILFDDIAEEVLRKNEIIYRNY